MVKSKKKMAQRGKFIVFEGLDGSGTSTQNKLLCHYLQEQKWPVLTTSEPSSGPIGLMLRLILSKRLSLAADDPRSQKLSDNSLALLFAADRLDHMQHTIVPRLDEGIMVICERYYLSSYAYQLGRDRAGLEWLRTINAHCLSPDLTIFLNTSVAVCDKRRQQRNRWNQELFEKSEILQRVAENYQYAISALRQENIPIEVIDGNPAEKVVFAEVVNAIQHRFPEMFPGDLPLFPA
jgi:dTMP kinase